MMSSCETWLRKRKKRKRAALMTYPSHALSKTRGLLATKCYSTWRQMIWWQWTMGECKKILPKEIVSNKNMRSDKWQIALFKMRWDAVEVLLSPSWAASQAPLIFQKGSAETFHLSIINFRNSYSSVNAAGKCWVGDSSRKDVNDDSKSVTTKCKFRDKLDFSFSWADQFIWAAAAALEFAFFQFCLFVHRHLQELMVLLFACVCVCACACTAVTGRMEWDSKKSTRE